jgi:pyruvate/2-oxoacid:ferredoxin oxidoreductase beta subunit
MSVLNNILSERVSIPPTAACQGCGMVLVARHALDVLGKKTVVVIPASCGGWSGVINAVRVPTQFPSAAASASGAKRALMAAGIKANVLVIAGDGGTYDIGLQALSGACERREPIIWICQNNEAYMNTGIQRSGATPKWGWTTTTPVGKLTQGKRQWQKDVPRIVEASGAAYVARASVAFIADYKRKLQKAQRISTEEEKGLSFIELQNTCPTGWRYSPEKMVEIARLGVLSGYWPLYEVEDGKFTLNYKPKELVPYADYQKTQGRFSHMTKEQVDISQDRVTANWNAVLKRAELGF